MLRPKNLTSYPESSQCTPEIPHCTLKTHTVPQEPHIVHYEYMQQPMLHSKAPHCTLKPHVAP